MTVVSWVDVFTHVNHKNCIIEALKYCIQNKGLNVYAFCIMPNHIHMVANTNPPFELQNTIRDFKKFTSKKIISQIKNEPESKREWMLKIFREAGLNNHKIKDYKFWQDGSHAIELFTEKFVWQKINYIHRNPVKQ